jgi:hypothetical protein
VGSSKPTSSSSITSNAVVPRHTNGRRIGPVDVADALGAASRIDGLTKAAFFTLIKNVVRGGVNYRFQPCDAGNFTARQCYLRLQVARPVSPVMSLVAAAPLPVALGRLLHRPKENCAWL